MEPASFAASILTLLAAAGATTEFVYNFILDIDDIPEEIHSQAIKLQCLHRTFSTLINTFTDTASHSVVQLEPFLHNHLRSFAIEIHKLEKKLRRSSTCVSGGRKQHLWARLKWLSSDRELRKFYGNLDDWMRIFLTAVHTTEIKMLTQIIDQTSRLHQVPTVAAHEWPQNAIITPAVIAAPANATLPPALRALLVQKAECVGHRVRRWYAFRTRAWLFDLRTGPTIIRTWSDEGKSVYKEASGGKGMCVSSTFRTQLLPSKRITFMFSYLLDGPKLSFNCNLVLHRLLQGTSPAYAACQKGYWLQLRNLLQDKHISISDTTGYGDTLLHIAARHNHIHLVTALLQSGAKVDAQNDFGETPLLSATSNNSAYDLLSSLISAGADLNHQASSGRTALHTFYNAATCALIKFHSAEISAGTLDARGRSAVHYVAWSKTSTVEHLDRVACGDLDMGARDKEGKTPLHYAVQRGNLGIVLRLLGQKDEMSRQPDYQGRTLLHYATESSRAAQTIDMLRDLNIDVHARDSQRRTALHHAAAAGNVRAVQKMLELGADADLREVDSDGRNVLQLAARCGRRAVVDVLSPYYGNEELLEEEEHEIGTGLVDCKMKRGERWWAWLWYLGALLICAILLSRWQRFQ